MRKPVKITQVGLSSVILYKPNSDVAIIQLCELPNIIAQLQEIQARVETPHSPDITGICTVCGNECVTNVDDDGNPV